MPFKLSKDRLYHTTHNVAIADEMYFLIKILSEERTHYSLQEIKKDLFLKEIEERQFRQFHSGPYNNFTKTTSDKRDLHNKLSNKIKQNKLKDLLPQIRKKIEEGENKVEVIKFIQNQRINNFKQFLEDPQSNFELIMNTIYKPTKKWEKNWVEFVRDFVDLASMFQLLPNYTKAGHIFSGFEKDFNISKIFYQIKSVMNDKEEFKEAFIKLILENKIKSSVMNLRNFSEYNIETRFYYCLLKVLKILNDKGVPHVHHSMLFGTVGCINFEDEIESASRYLYNFIKKFSNIIDVDVKKYFSHNEKFYKEAGRISTGLKNFPLNLGLIKTKTVSRNQFIKITDKGIKALEGTPFRTIFYKNYSFNEKFQLNALHTHLLYKSYTLSKNDKEYVIDKYDFFNDLQDITIDDIEKQVYQLLEILDPKPFRIEADNVIISKSKNQIAIAPYLDFDSKEIIDFIIEGGNIPEFSQALVDIPTFDEIKKIYNENNLRNIIEDLKIGKVHIVNNNVLWIMKIYDEDIEDVRYLSLLFLKYRNLDTEIKKVKDVLKSLHIKGIHETDLWIFYIRREVMNKEEIEDLDERLYSENIVPGVHKITNISLDCFFHYLRYLYEQFDKLVLRFSSKMKKSETREKLMDYVIDTPIKCFWEWGGFEDKIIFDASQFRTKFLR